MRLWNIADRLMPCLLAAGACLLLSPTDVTAQDLLPAVRFTADAGDWASDGNWALAGSDPAEEGAPGEGEIASIQNGGVVTLSAEAAGVQALAISDGAVHFATGGSLAVAGQTIVGGGGTLGVAGGALTTDSLAVYGSIDVASEVATDLSFGTSYPVATTSSLVNNVSEITIGGAAPVLPAGMGLGLVSTDTGAAVVVESFPVLEIDRLTGVGAIKNLNGGPTEFKGYSILSDGGNIARRGRTWNSLEDQEIAGWAEANPTLDSRFSEVNLLGSTVLNVGDSLDMGALYTGIGNSPAQEDIEFEVLLADGRVVTPEVMFLGAPNDLVLNVDPATGAASISHTSTLIDPFDVTGISIVSNSGSLLSDNFTGIGADGWTNSNPQATGVADVNLTGSQVFANGTSIDVGNIFNIEGARDLTFQFSTSDNALRTGTVVYGAPGEPPVIVDPPPTGCDPNTQGDIDGNGVVEFADFLTISANFGNEVADHTLGDIDCNGVVEFADFLTLSANFGNTAGGAAAVPEPASGLLFFIGFLGMLKLRRSRIAAVVAVATVCCAASQTAMGQGFDTRFIRLHPDGPNGQINSTLEARGIANGSVQDVIINEDISAETITIDFGGGPGSYANDQSPYLNGVDNDSMNDFMQYVSGTLEIPEGDWTVGCGSDDGCLLNLPGVVFENTFNENGPSVDGDGEVLFNAGRGHAWTGGTFSVGADGLTTGFEALFFERGGGDSFELAYVDAKFDPDADGDFNTFMATGFELDTGEANEGFGEWNMVDAPFASVAGDFNADGVVDAGDADILLENFGNEGGFSDGDMDLDGSIGFGDVAAFAPIFASVQVAGAPPVRRVANPEPAGLSLGLLAAGALLGIRRRRQRA